MSLVFTYPPLTEQDHIRVILLQPALARDDELIGSFQHISLDNHYYDLIDPYTALSYVWGEHTLADSILLDGQKLGITANLGAALRDLRDGDRTHRVWADALCIDQDNIPERNKQVALMGQIYSRANNTVIYLGPLTPHAEVILREVHRFALLGPDAEHSPGDEEAIIKAANEGLLVQPWFHRVWVLQELVLSREPWVQFGPKRIRWQDMCRLLMPPLRQRRLDEDTEGDVTVLESMNSVRADYWKNHPASLFSYPPPRKRVHSNSDEHERRRDPCRLWNLLNMRKNCGVTDLRDMVFAHMGIISDREEAFKYIKIDYSQTTSDLFTAVGRYIERRKGLLSLIHFLGPPRTPNLVLPSWVPSWGRPVHGGVSEPDLEKSLSNPFSASCRAEAFPIMSFVEIESVSDVLPRPPSPENLHRQLDEPWKSGVPRVKGQKNIDWEHQTIGSFPRETNKRLYVSKPKSRSALLTTGVRINVPLETTCGDLLLDLVTSTGNDYGLSKIISEGNSQSYIGAVVHPDTPPGAGSWERAYVSNYVAAISQRYNDRSADIEKIFFLHGRLLGVQRIVAPSGTKFSWRVDKEQVHELADRWSTHDVAERLARRRNTNTYSRAIACVLVLHWEPKTSN
ncbi:heterokaryon incompatibility protein-domain-containing protein [Nemania serpens]|nr:heterokaryon incompatibility protein-domain-containing protein [Nemania serpens]